MERALSHAAFVKCFGSTVFLGVQTSSIGRSCCLCGTSSFFVEKEDAAFCLLARASLSQPALACAFASPISERCWCFTFLLRGAVGLGSGSTTCPQQCVPGQGWVQWSRFAVPGEQSTVIPGLGPLGSWGLAKPHTGTLVSLSVLFCS